MSPARRAYPPWAKCAEAPLTGVLSILAGIVILIYPGISLLALAVVVGIWLLVFGFMEIRLALQIRSLAHQGR